jgi:ABC-type glucose/galactose transport system permease subunit
VGIKVADIALSKECFEQHSYAPIFDLYQSLKVINRVFVLITSYLLNYVLIKHIILKVILFFHSKNIILKRNLFSMPSKPETSQAYYV